MDFSDAQILTSILNVFREASVGGALHLIPHARSLLILLGIINICTTWSLYEGQLRMSQCISQIMKISFFFFLILNWVELNGMIMNSFKLAGLTAAGLDTTNTPLDVTSPSSIVTTGFLVVKNLLEELSHVGFNFGNAFLLLISILLVVIAFFIIAFQLMLTQIEFNIFAGIAVILMPFGIIRYTQFLFQRCISAVFAFGVKLMLMYFLIGITIHFVGKEPAAITAKGAEFSQILTAACSYLILGFLCWKIPNLAATMIQGMPSMDGSGIIARTGHYASRPVVYAGNKVATKLAEKTKAAAGYAYSTGKVYADKAAISLSGTEFAHNVSQMAGTPVPYPQGSRPSRDTFNQNISDAISKASQTKPQSSDLNRFS